MERYRNFVRMEQIKEYIRAGKNEEALALAEQTEPAKVKSNSDLTLISDLYLESGMLAKAGECLSELYSRKKSRSLLMQLINLSVRLKKVEEAEKYFREFRDLAPDDFYNHIFRYSIDKIKGKNTETLIQSLEKLKEAEYIDSWAYELAKLYHKAGRKDDCIRECDDIVTWFGDGEFVDRAKALKAYYLGELADVMHRTPKEERSGAPDREEYYTGSAAEEVSAAAEDESGQAGYGAAEAEEAEYDGSEYVTAEMEESQYDGSEYVTAEAEESQYAQPGYEAAAAEGPEYSRSDYEGTAAEEPEYARPEYEAVVGGETENGNYEYAEVEAEEQEYDQADYDNDDAGYSADSEAMQEEAVNGQPEAAEDIEEPEQPEQPGQPEPAAAPEAIEVPIEPEAPVQAENAMNAGESADTGEAAEENDYEEDLREFDRDDYEITLAPEVMAEIEGYENGHFRMPSVDISDVIDEAGSESAEEQRIEDSREEVLEEELEEESPEEDVFAADLVVREFKAKQQVQIAEDSLLGTFLREHDSELEDYFGFFAYQKDIRGQLVKTLEILLNPQIKNKCVVVSGEHNSGSKSIMKGITKILLKGGFLRDSQLALTEAEKINSMRLTEKMGQLIGKCLIINHAGRLSAESVAQLLEVNPSFAGKTAVILSDTRSELSRLMKENREINSMFPLRIHIPAYDEEDFEDLLFVRLEESGLSIDKAAFEAVRVELKRIVRETKEGSLAEADRYIGTIMDAVQSRNAGKIMRSGTASIKNEDMCVLKEDIAEYHKGM